MPRVQPFAIGACIPTKPAIAAGLVLGRLPGGSPYQRVKPVVRGPLARWIIDIRERREDEWVIGPDCHVVELRNAMVLNGLVFTEEGVLIKESLINRQHDESFLGLSRSTEPDVFVVRDTILEPEISIAGRHVLLAQQFDGNYGHWLCECLSKMLAIQDCTDTIDASYVVSWHPSSSIMRVFEDSLSCYGVTRSQIVAMGAEPKKFDCLVYATPMTNTNWIKSPLVVHMLENLASRIGRDDRMPRKLFVSRPETERRRLLNHAEARTVALKAGYVDVCPARMSFREQVSTFSKAQCVIGVLGADCTNVVFCPGGIHFLGLAPSEMQDDFYWDLVSHKNGRYYCLHGRCIDDRLGMNSDFTIDIGEFERLIDDMESVMKVRPERA